MRFVLMSIYTEI